MTRKPKNTENETQTLFDLEYGRKHSKTFKIGNAKSRTLYMVRKLKIMENEKYTLQDLDCGEKTENIGKLDTNTV